MEDGIARSFGTCMTMGTASTMAAAVEALGLTTAGRVFDSPLLTQRTRAWPPTVVAASSDMVWEDLDASDNHDHRSV
jgi:dihydroxy-acid dehydratase